MKHTLCVLLVLFTGCGLAVGNRVSSMNPREIASVDDASLCHPLAKGPIVERERARRGLGDCSPAHLQCRSMGYQMGTSNYLECRRMTMQQETAAAVAYEAHRQKMLDGVANAYRVPPTTRTNCTSNSPDQMNCTSRTTPY